MRMPSPVKITRNGVEYISNIDRTIYTMQQLNLAALREIAKLIRKRMLQQARLQTGMKRSKRISKSFQYWVRKREGDLLVGIKHNTWYGVEQEMGTHGQRKKAILTNTVLGNINDIRRIAGIYIASIEDENKAAGLIRDDGGWTGDENDG